MKGGKNRQAGRRQVADVDDIASGGEAAGVDYRRSSALPEGRCGFEQSSRRFLGCDRWCCYFRKQLRKWACRQGCWQSFFFPAPYWNQNKKTWMEHGWRTLQQRCLRDDIWPVSYCGNLKHWNDTNATLSWPLTPLIFGTFCCYSCWGHRHLVQLVNTNGNSKVFFFFFSSLIMTIYLH